MNQPSSPIHVVIVGAGFGGIAAAKYLQYAKNIEITLIDRHNYHLFQPLLYQVACAMLSPDQIAVPIRTLFSKASNNIKIVMDEVVAVNPTKHTINTRKKQFTYDYLILAPGSEDNFFGNEAIANYCFSLKSLQDATMIRQAALRCFEEAEINDDPQERQRLTTFVIIGGGPTGVEMAGALAELSSIVSKEFTQLNPLNIKIILIEAGARILPSFPELLSLAAEKALREKGVTIYLNTKVEKIDRNGLYVGKQFIQAATIIWSAGVKASPIQRWFQEPLKAGKGERIIVEKDLSLPGFTDLFVIGDAAAVIDKNGHILPGVAPVAKQQGHFVAKLIMHHLRNPEAKRPQFFYRNYGSLATIGRYFAIADFGKIQLKGILGWFIWGVAHIYYLIGFRNRMMVILNWLWEYIFYARGNRLIIQEKKPD
ncbi:MAG: NAD(P)/FAD-dependent oxidoreductase [Burkholderiales bacterium]